MDVLRNQRLRLPRRLAVTLVARATECPLMDVLMTSSTTLTREVRHRSTIVVTQQAPSGGVRAVQRDPGLLGMIELEVRHERVPIRTRVAKSTIAREAVVRQHGAKTAPPAVHRRIGLAAADAGADHQQRQEATEPRRESVSSSPRRGGNRFRVSLHQNRRCTKKPRASARASSQSVTSVSTDKFQPSPRSVAQLARSRCWMRSSAFESRPSR